MDLLSFGNLLLMRQWVLPHILVLLWYRAQTHPQALLHSGGPVSCKFQQLTRPLIDSEIEHPKECIAIYNTFWAGAGALG